MAGHMVHIDFGHFLGHEVKVPGTTIERYKVTTRLAKPTAPRMLSPFFWISERQRTNPNSWV